MSQASNNQLTRLMKSMALTRSATSTGLSRTIEGKLGVYMCIVHPPIAHGRRREPKTWAVKLMFMFDSFISQR